MKGYIGIVIPTKPYIKAYLRHRLGDCLIMSRKDNEIGAKFYDLLRHKVNESKNMFRQGAFKTTIKVYVSYRAFRIRGCHLNESNVIALNNFLEEQVKNRFYFLMDTYIGILPSFEANLPQVRKDLGIGDEDWTDDSMRKDYWRYRRRKGKALLYNKVFPNLSHGSKPF